MVVDVPIPSGGTVKQIGNPIKFSKSQPEYKSIGMTVAYGTHTRDILREMGFTDKEIEDFENTGLFR